MRAVVCSDVIQMCVLVVGLLVSIGFAIAQVGDFSDVPSAFPQDRQRMIDFSSGIGDGAAMPVWAFVFGGLFLYMAYYGTDQSQAQRLLATRSVADSQKALMLNGYGRLPLIVLYVVFGVCLYAVPHADASFATSFATSVAPARTPMTSYRSSS